jgi:hypothetical protein
VVVINDLEYLVWRQIEEFLKVRVVIGDVMI